MRPAKFVTLSIIIILLSVFFSIYGAVAAEPLWTYSSQGSEISGLTVSSDGSAIAVGAGKIWLFSRNGTLLAKEPYGDQVIFTPDGNFLISSYSDTIYKFKRISVTKGSEAPLQKIWDASPPGIIHSFDVTDDGRIIVTALDDGGIYIYDATGNLLGGGSIHTPIIRISPYGNEIVGVSDGKLCLFNLNVECSASDVGVVGALPNFMELTDSGNIAVFDDGPRIRSVFLGNETLRWRTNADGDVTSLAMTSTGSKIAVGTSDGNISLFDQYGNISWRYVSNPGKSQNGEISNVALSKDGSVTAAGSNDGKIFALNSSGMLLWSNKTTDRIHHIAMSSDGSLVVATGENTVYAFGPSTRFPGVVRITPVSVKQTSSLPIVTSVAENSPTQKPASRETTFQEITAEPTEYSIIRTTQSPLSWYVPIIGLMIFTLIAKRAVIRRGKF